MEPSCTLEFDGMCVFVRLIINQSMESSKYGKEKKIQFSVVEIRPRLSLNQDTNFCCGGGKYNNFSDSKSFSKACIMEMIKSAINFVAETSPNNCP